MSKFFSISTKDIYPFRRKTIKICGIKFSYKYRPKKMLLSLPESEVSRMGICSNRNLIFYVIDYLQRHDNDVLYCLKNDMVCYIFNKRILDWGVDNFRQFIINSPWLLQKILDFQILQPYSNLYQDHIERAAKGEFFWKYTLKKGLILHKFFSYGADNKVYVNEAIVDDNHTISDTSEPYFRAKNFQRPFIEGVDLGKHFHQHLKTIEDKKEILIKLIEYIFAKYSLPNGKIDNTLYDCHLSNFIMDNDGNFHFIDDEFVSPEPLEKRYIVDCLLKDIVNPKTNNEIREYFGFPQIKISAKNEKDKLTELREKYFS